MDLRGKIDEEPILFTMEGESTARHPTVDTNFRVCLMCLTKQGTETQVIARFRAARYIVRSTPSTKEMNEYHNASHHSELGAPLTLEGQTLLRMSVDMLFFAFGEVFQGTNKFPHGPKLACDWWLWER